MPTAEWHWEQGMKYAVEGIRTALLLNGAAGIALLTFIGKHTFSEAMIAAIVLFAIGSFLSALGFSASYMTQLEYGNAEIPGRTETDKNAIWRKGQCWNKRAIYLVIGSVTMFGIGILLAACALI